ncbi:hypothetical protein L150_05432, partial [Candida albicans Ca529L]
MNQQTEGKEEITQGERRKLVDIKLDFFTCCCCCRSCGCVSIIKSMGGDYVIRKLYNCGIEREREKKKGGQIKFKVAIWFKTGRNLFNCYIYIIQLSLSFKTHNFDFNHKQNYC